MSSYRLYSTLRRSSFSRERRSSSAMVRGRRFFGDAFCSSVEAAMLDTGVTLRCHVATNFQIMLVFQHYLTTLLHALMVLAPELAPDISATERQPDTIAQRSNEYIPRSGECFHAHSGAFEISDELDTTKMPLEKYRECLGAEFRLHERSTEPTDPLGKDAVRFA